MPHEIIIRPIQKSDFAAYRELRLEALKAHPESFGSDYAEQAADPDSAWLDRIRISIEGKMSRLFLAEADPDDELHELVNDLLLSPMGRRDWPLRFYSAERLFSVEARRKFVTPDLAALP